MKNRILKLLAVISGIIAITILNGIVLTVLWNWFIVEIFACNPIEFLQAIGLSLIIRYIKSKTDNYQFKSYDDINWREVIIPSLVRSIIVLALASLLHYLL